MEGHGPARVGLRERVAYLIGLTRARPAAGDQGAVLPEILDVLADMARELDQLRVHLAELADEVFGGDTALLHCAECGQAMRVLTADLHDDRVELICPGCGHVVHGYDHGLDYDEDDDVLESGRPEGTER